MALSDFWVSIRSAAHLVAPQVTVDAPSLNPNDIERALRGATFWLTPRAVAGFIEADFEFLPDADRERLAQLVSGFRDVASGVNPTAPATDDQVSRALPLFRDIVGMMEFDRYGDAEAFRLGKKIERAIEPYRPDQLAELRFNTGSDHSGNPAIWIWAFLTDAASETDERFLENARHLRQMLDHVARTIAPDRWPYLSFRSLSEQAEPVEAS